MPLTASYLKIKDFRENFPTHKDEDGIESENGTVMTVLYYHLFLGMSEITEKTISEFYTRMKMYDKVFEPVGTREGKLAPIPYDTLKKLIGLTANASQETTAQFNKRLMSQLRKETESEIRKEIK